MSRLHSLAVATQLFTTGKELIFFILPFKNKGCVYAREYNSTNDDH